MTSVPIRTEETQKGSPCDNRGTVEVLELPAKEWQRLWGKAPEATGRKGQVLPCKLQRDCGPADSLISGF